MQARHRSVSPDCPFVRDQSDNMPDGEDTEDVVEDKEDVVDQDGGEEEGETRAEELRGEWVGEEF